MKVLVTPRSYGKSDPEVFNMLEAAGLTVVRNDTGAILTKDAIRELIADCDGVILGVDPMDADVLAAAPKLKAIAKYGVGVDNIDLDAAQERGIRVSRTVGANSDAVADYAFSLMAVLARKVVFIDRNCRQGDWKKITTQDISHATLGILGFGAIGKNLARRAEGFDMKIMAYDVYWDEPFATAHNVAKATPEEIYRDCDFISLHLPLLDSTKNFIGREQLAQMKSSAILVNTARGGLIDEDALLVALKNGKIAGAGLDVFAQEPPDSAWFALDNVIIGSHCAASTSGAAQNMGRMATQNLIRDLSLLKSEVLNG